MIQKIIVDFYAIREQKIIVDFYAIREQKIIVDFYAIRELILLLIPSIGIAIFTFSKIIVLYFFSVY
ncbi:hypothetical protein [Wolbachia endosymbiont (group B) of Colias croceus]|uniref:hypothetical protein n=1 Tax=Wolbachia endosymbiont (group B) of Colias croceus TaxID=2953998 RepID=UPI0022266EEE|nr:hypothetical protein [Wolbachia endosymbiont (group B) of Colias croceus]